MPIFVSYPPFCAIKYQISCKSGKRLPPKGRVFGRWGVMQTDSPLPHSLICKFKETELTLNLDIEATLLSPFSLINHSFSLSGSGVSPEHGGPTPCNLSAAASSSTASCSLTTVILVGLRLALGALGLGVGRARRVWLLHWHGPSQVGALAKEVGLCWETEGTFPQDHADGGGLLGSGSVSKLKRGEVRCIAIAEKLNVSWRESQKAATSKTLTAKVRRYQVKLKLRWRPDYLALVLVLLWRPANNVNLWGAEAQHVVNRDVLHGAISWDDLDMALFKGENKPKVTSLKAKTCPVSVRAFRLGCTSWMRFLRKMVFCRRGSWTKPSEKKIIPWGKLCCESQETTRCFCMSGRPVM